MALKWHPDRNKGSDQANQKFKEISEAFEVLSDSNKRAVYDQFGEEGLKGSGPVPGQGGPGGGFSGFGGGFPGGKTSFSFSTGGPGGASFSSTGFSPTDASKIFEQVFGGSFFPGMAGGMGGMGGSGRKRGQSMFEMDVDDDDFGAGGFSTSGGMPGGMPGSARPPSRQNRPPSEITKPFKVSLNDLYTGATKRIKVGRKLLNGATEDKVLEIHINPGWKSGTKIRFPRAGNEQPDGEAQDLVFLVEEKPHDVFKREVDDLVCHMQISLLDALTGGGGKKFLELLDGRKLQVPTPVGIVKPGQETRIHGEGMPVRKGGNVQNKGDLIIKWDVVFPQRLTTAQQEGLRKVLG